MKSKNNEDKLWDTWKERYGEDNDKLVKDGIGDVEAYNRSKTKLLFILREPNGWEGADMRTQLKQGRKYAIWHRVAEWAYGIQNSFPSLEKLPGNELNKALNSVAAINIKKMPGGSQSYLKDIDLAALVDRDLLKRQIEMIQPDVILCCGTYNPTLWVLRDIVHLDPMDKGIKDFVKLWEKSVIVNWRHPGRAPKKTYGELGEAWKKVKANLDIK